MARYLPDILKAAKWIGQSVVRNRKVDPDWIESEAEDFVMDTVRRMTDPCQLKQEFGRWLEQRLSKRFWRNSKPTVLGKEKALEVPLPATLTEDAELGRMSIEEMVESIANQRDVNGHKVLNREDKELLLGILYKDDGQPLSTILRTDRQRNRWSKRIKPSLMSWAVKEGLCE